MRKNFGGILVLMFFVVSMAAVSAAKSDMGIADAYKANFSQQVRVAGTLLPQGDYEIRHVMEGADHIMVFRQLGTKKPVEVRAKCTLVPLTAKATRDEKIYAVDGANERILQEMVFKGDRAKHVF
jgi:hypothetical protein